MNTASHKADAPRASRILQVPPGEEDDVWLGLLSRNTGSPNKSLPPVLLVHGATFGSELFDLPLPGYSLMEELAAQGRPIYALDVRGYGHSLGGQQMNDPPALNPPFARIDDAIKDIGTVVKFILRLEEAGTVHLVGFSWGTIACARYVCRESSHVSRLALYAPLYAEMNPMWLERIGDPNDRTKLDPNIGAYRFVKEKDVRSRWDADIGSPYPDVYREPDLPEVIFESLASLDPLAYAQQPPAFRSPTGALADLVGIFNGQPLFDPEKITIPVLLIRGANDTTSTDTDARNLLGKIASKQKEYEVVSPGSHFLCVEKNRAKLYQSLNKFLSPVGPDLG